MNIKQTAAAAHAAADRISAAIVRTPLQRSKVFSERCRANVFFKLENQQTSGSFKLRGASNRLMTLSEDELARGCVAASSGNHGAAVACAMQSLGVKGVIFVPQETSSAKIDMIRSYGGDVRMFGVDGLETELHARTYAAKNNMCYLSPYNDAAVIAGQGTMGVEILQQCPEIDVAIVAVGGGGLIAGVGSVIKSQRPDARIIGCQPLASPVMARSVAAGEILDLPSEPTLSDGTTGGIEPDAITFPLNQAVVDQYVTVTEVQIAAAMKDYFDSESERIEGAAGVAVAALLEKAEDLAGANIAVIICGGNISEDKYQQAMAML